MIDKMVKQQALENLMRALEDATEIGLLDDLASDIHPDVINTFCDGVEDVFKRLPVGLVDSVADSATIYFVSCSDGKMLGPYDNRADAEVDSDRIDGCVVESTVNRRN